MDNFIQITVFCPPEPRVGSFVYRNAGKVYWLSMKGRFLYVQCLIFYRIQGWSLTHMSGWHNWTDSKFSLSLSFPPSSFFFCSWLVLLLVYTSLGFKYCLRRQYLIAADNTYNNTCKTHKCARKVRSFWTRRLHVNSIIPFLTTGNLRDCLNT